MLKKNKVLFTLLFTFLLYIILSPGTTLPVPAENLDIPAGFALDLVTDQEGNKSYISSVDVYTFNKQDEIGHYVLSGKGTFLPETRENRQLKGNHKFIYGLEKVMLVSEAVARNGIGNLLDILFSNQYMHDMGWLIVCKGKAADYLSLKVGDYPSSSDYIEGMINNSKEQNFFSDNYKIMDAYVRVGAEGRSLVLPYLEIRNGLLQISGSAIFKKDRMLEIHDMEDTKIMNFLREDKARGILILGKEFDKQVALFGTVRRKVRSQRDEDGKFIFEIDLTYTGEVISNTLYPDYLGKVDAVHDLEVALAKDTERKAKAFIEKMQKEYKIDCLDLGREAAAKYGRGKVKDWNVAVSESEIKVKVTVKAAAFGRGQYTAKPK